MSKIAARMAKMKAENLGGIQRHNQRETENHSNKDIDSERSKLNYDLVNPEPVNYHEKVLEIINSQRLSKRAIRKDAVLVDEWIITSDKQFFEMADSKKFFQDSLDYFSERCGLQNIAYATVHLDETTPHMHLGIVPMSEGRLNHKLVFTRQTLREIQDELPKYLQEQGHEIERGIKGSEQKHLTVTEYKENKLAVERMNAELQQKDNALSVLDRQMASKKQASTNELAETWKQDWLVTKEEFPSFEMTYEVRDTTTLAFKHVSVNEHTPTDYGLTFHGIINLFKEKYTQLKDYIALKWQNLTDRAVEIERKHNYLNERENGLETKLDGLNAEVQTKEIQSNQLTELIEEKKRYIKRLTDIAELSTKTPSYVKPSKLNKEVWIVPKDKWDAKHVSANVVSDMFNQKYTFTHAENMIQRQAQEGLSNWELKSANMKLERENKKLSNDYVALHNGVVKLYNKEHVSKKELESVLSERLLEQLGFQPKQQTKQKGLDGPSMSL